MENCIFCKIVSGELPSYKVYENEGALAFLDITPVSPGHVLVIPKKHYANLEAIPEEDLIGVIKAVKKVGAKIKSGLGVEGYNVMENNDPVSGQLIPHLHFHLIPRKEDDGLQVWPRFKYGEGEAEDVASSLKL